MALVPHKDDTEGKKAFDEKMKAVQKGGKAAAEKVKTENNIDVAGKTKVAKPSQAI